MSQYYGAPPNPGYTPTSAQNLQFYSSNYAQPVSGHATPSQASYGYGGPTAGGYGDSSSFSSGFGPGPDVSGRMGEQGGLRTGWLAAFSTEGYPGEPPLLEELGVNVGHIRAKTLAVLNPFSRVDQHLMDDSDLAGPLLFFLLYGTFLLLSGRVHFGYIYGLAVFGSILLHTILSLMAPSPTDPPGGSNGAGPSYPGVVSPAYPADATAMGGGSSARNGGQAGDASSSSGSSGLTFARSASVLGYCLLPLVATSLAGIFVPMDTPFGIVLTTAAIMWCTWSASGIFCAVGGMRGMRGLVAYPLMLFYVGFGIMGVFSSRGSGSFAKVAVPPGP
ncbi:b2100c37-04f8-4861-bca5-808c1e3b630d [Thermothielavioides terrestris]|uniref:B2100c37-04f8-4861-bca5-808c1e3b630d n=1 Tax=Thermothielavioides terrestris TaxID=2587410 RepID=A0A3S4F4C2_9PEZI|nr:b2100c37-04f8-4861-bca5-808c1e3b630d [Thermothielavioides terrestris]